MNIKHFCTCWILLIIILPTSSGQKITSIDIVQAKQGDMREVNYFYENNWLKFRKEALSGDFISGYKYLQSPIDSYGLVTITLITEYKDSAQYKLREENFRPIMKKISPDGPNYLNNRKNRDFLKYISGSEGEHKWDSENNIQEFSKSNDPETRAIAAVLMDYIEGTVNSDQDRLRRAFHKDFKLYGIHDKDSLWIRDGQEYINNFKPGQKNNRPGKIISIDYVKDAAQARAEIYFPNGRIFTDFFLLMKYGGSWKIVQKSYTWVSGEKVKPKSD